MQSLPHIYGIGPAFDSQNRSRRITKAERPQKTGRSMASAGWMSCEVKWCEGGGRCRDPGGTPTGWSARIIHVEFDGMWGHFEAHHFGHLQFDEGIDEIVVEDTADLEESAVLVEIGEGLAE